MLSQLSVCSFWWAPGFGLHWIHVKDEERSLKSTLERFIIEREPKLFIPEKENLTDDVIKR